MLPAEPSVAVLTAAASSSLTRLELVFPPMEEDCSNLAGLSAALEQLQSLRCLSLCASNAEYALGALSRLHQLRRLEWRELAMADVSAVLEQLPLSVATLLLDLEVEDQHNDEDATDVALDCSHLTQLRSLNVTATLWDDDGHCLWEGRLQPKVPASLTRLVMTGRGDDIRGAMPALEQLSLTEWWFGTSRLSALIAAAAPTLRSLHLAEYVPENERDYHQHMEPMTLAELQGLAAAIGAASQLTRLVLQLGSDFDKFHEEEEAVGSELAAVLPGLGSLEVLVLGPGGRYSRGQATAVRAACLSSLTRLSVLHLEGAVLDTPAFVGLCAALPRLVDLRILLGGFSGSAAPLFSAAAALTSLTRAAAARKLLSGRVQRWRPRAPARLCQRPEFAAAAAGPDVADAAFLCRQAAAARCEELYGQHAAPDSCVDPSAQAFQFA